MYVIEWLESNCGECTEKAIEWLESSVEKRARQEYEMSPSLFNVFLDQYVRNLFSCNYVKCVKKPLT